MQADWRIDCTDANHKAFEVYAGIMVFVYPVGIPLLYAVLLFERRDVLADADEDKTVAQPIAGLWEAYRPERFYYEVGVCGRRIMLTGVVVFVSRTMQPKLRLPCYLLSFSRWRSKYCRRTSLSPTRGFRAGVM